jgi:glucosylceramidase
VRRLGTAVLAALVAILGAGTSAQARAKPPSNTPTPGPRVSVVVTSANLRKALSPAASTRFYTAAPRRIPVIQVHPSLTYQRFRGAGGAMTDTAAWLIEDELRSGARNRLMHNLFTTRGIDLNMIRVPIGASDFTALQTPYSYDDMPAGQSDPTLSHFSIAHDQAYIIPALRQAISLAPRTFLMASMWSPPGWMKTNDQLGNQADTGSLLPSAYGPLAAYFVRFLEAYAQQGLFIQGLSPQNEPGQGAFYPAMNETADEEADFIHWHLVPALRAAGLDPEIFGFDGPWAGGARFAFGLLRTPAVSDLAGIATHCYYGSPTVMAALHHAAPQLDEIESECSPGAKGYPDSELEIGSLRNWASAVELWNIALDQRGGPVQPPNDGCRRCTSIAVVSTITHRVRLTLNYYELGQLTRFVVPGAVRIASNSLVAYGYNKRTGTIVPPGLSDVAFLDPNGQEVLLAYNGGAPIRFAVQQGSESFAYQLGTGETATFVWRP